MDAKALLMSQGWSGPGNPLNPGRRPGTHGGLGLTKPILVARKQNTLGVGKKTVDHSNQWWLRGFEAALKGVGTPGISTPASQDSYCPGLSAGSELHRFFVSGGILVGTIDAQAQKSAVTTVTTEKSDSSDSTSDKSSSCKRKRGDDKGEGLIERVKRKEKTKKRKVAEENEVEGSDDKHAQKLRKKADKELKKQKKIERRKAKEEKEEKKQAKLMKKARKEEKKLAAAAIAGEHASDSAKVESITPSQSSDPSDIEKNIEEKKSIKKEEKKRKQKSPSENQYQEVDADKSKKSKEKKEKKKKREQGDRS